MASDGELPAAAEQADETEDMETAEDDLDEKLFEEDGEGQDLPQPQDQGMKFNRHFDMWAIWATVFTLHLISN